MSDDKNLDTEVEYSYEWYSGFLDHLSGKGYSFAEFGKKPRGRDAFVRHDVDWSPENALDIAQIEREMGVSSTFFFLLTSPFYNLFEKKNRQIVNDIEEMGHGIGLHFGPDEVWDGEPSLDELVNEVEKNLDIFSTITEEEPDTVAFHNPPGWVLGSRYDGFTSTYEERYFDEITYVADSLNRWMDSPPLENGTEGPIQILTHPTLWDTTHRSAEENVRGVQERIIQKTDEAMGELSRLDW